MGSVPGRGARLRLGDMRSRKRTGTGSPRPGSNISVLRPRAMFPCPLPYYRVRTNAPIDAKSPDMLSYPYRPRLGIMDTPIEHVFGPISSLPPLSSQDLLDPTILQFRAFLLDRALVQRVRSIQARAEILAQERIA